MKISSLVDKNYRTVSVLEDTRDIFEWLRDERYLAVQEENSATVGIITILDLLTHPESRAVCDCDFNKTHVQPEQSVFEVFTIMKDSQSDYLPVYDNGTFIGVISLMAITERLVNTLNANQQNYQKAVHDLRNPISNLQGLNNILNISLHDEENKELIHLANLSCRHALDILDDLLFVELDESKPFNKVDTELNHFYGQCINEQLGLSLLKQIKVVTDYTTAEEIHAIDRNQLKRAVQNVFSNAVKFSYPGSVIKIITKISDGKFVLKIVDAGIGIPQKLQSEIFKKFTIAQRAGTNGEASTGLGLCFSKQCIEQHGGTIYFKSKEGQGSKFYISI